MTTRPGHHRAATAGGRGAEDPRGAPHLVAGRRRRRARRRRAPPARSVAHGDVLTPPALRPHERPSSHPSGAARAAAPAAAVRRRRRADRRHASSLDADGRESKRFSHPRRHRARLGAPGRAADGRCCRRAPSASTAERARQLGIAIVRQAGDDKLPAFDEILAEHGLDRRGRRLHGRRPARPAGAAPARGSRRRRPTRWPTCARASTWSARRRGGDGAVRELIEARAARAGPLGRHRSSRAIAASGAPADGWLRRRSSRRSSRSWSASPSARPGSATSCRKAAGSIGAQGARVAALHAGPELPGRQPARSGDRRAEPGRARSPRTRSRST